jgi:hypothetical protein
MATNAEINFKVKRDPSGTFFIHGLYFAHEPEQNLIKFSTRLFKTGTRKEEYIPKPPKSDPPSWVRNPNNLF